MDIGKGFFAVWLARWLGSDAAAVAFCVPFVASGQMWPVFRKFDGEKGNTTGFGASVALAAAPALVALIPVFLAILSKVVKALRLKNVPAGRRFKTGAGQSNALPLGVALAMVILPVAASVTGQPDEVVWAFAALSLLMSVRRLTAGLSRDIAIGAAGWRNFWSRLLLDRPTADESRP